MITPYPPLRAFFIEFFCIFVLYGTHSKKLIHNFGQLFYRQRLQLNLMLEEYFLHKIKL